MINYLLLGGLAIGLGLLIGKGTHRLRITGVVGYIIAGFILGPEVLGVLELAAAEVETITNFSLAFVAFIIGGELTLTLMRRQGRSILVIILGETLGAFFMVFAFVYLVTADLPKAIIFAAMAPASAPAGAVAIIQEYKARGTLTNAILAVVGLDDGLAIFIYAFSIAIAGGLLAAGGFSAASMLVDPLVDTGGALLLGLAVGLGAAFIFRRLVEREEIIAVSLTAILLTAGLATLLDVSLILASLAMGMTVTNVFPRVNRPVFDAVKVISLPVYVLFFVL
ncbi:MAG: cation:proton antiporter, partial [Candidatus Thermoplasmatota archaeon]|nr:cation:proton antiporter [Candidatus Thermoplasmatota archaeon]